MGLVVSARSKADQLVEMIELPDHPWFVACQFHPEFLYQNSPFSWLLFGGTTSQAWTLH